MSRVQLSAVRTLVLVLAALGLPGCVRRTILITSDPPGSLVWLNDREIGRTPVDVEFVHYGTYDVRLIQEGYEPMMTYGDAKPPWWDNVGADLVAELVPWEVRSDIAWHYTLVPRETDPDQVRARLLENAAQLREAAEVD